MNRTVRHDKSTMAFTQIRQVLSPITRYTSEELLLGIQVLNAMHHARRFCTFGSSPRTTLELARLVQARPGLYSIVTSRLRKNPSKA